MMPNTQYDLVIVGAGVVGASLAAYAKKYTDLNIALIDVNFDYQDRIVGELLQPSGVATVESMGLGDCLQSIDAQHVYGYALFNKTKHFSIPYATNTPNQITSGRGITNGRFLQALRKAASGNVRVTKFSGRVQNLLYQEDEVVGINYIHPTEGEQSIYAKTVIASDGFFSKLRKGIHVVPPKVTSYFIGLELEDCTLPYEQYGHIITSDEANILCYNIARNTTRVLIDYPSTTMPTKDEAFKDFILNQIPELLPASIASAYSKQVDISKLKYMPNHYLPAKIKQRPKGLVLLGDALNMRHPLTGGGMTVGLKDVKHFADICLPVHGQANFESAVSAFYDKRNEWSTTVNILADALYQVVKNEKLREACFSYLGAENDNYKEPISLLAGINTNKIDLLKHFVAVAVNGSLQKATPEQDLKGRIMHSKDIFTDASKIILPLIKNELKWL